MTYEFGKTVLAFWALASLATGLCIAGVALYRWARNELHWRRVRRNAVRKLQETRAPGGTTGRVMRDVHGGASVGTWPHRSTVERERDRWS